MRVFLQSTHFLVFYDLRRLWYKCGIVLMAVISLKTINASWDVSEYSVETVAINPNCVFTYIRVCTRTYVSSGQNSEPAKMQS